MKKEYTEFLGATWEVVPETEKRAVLAAAKACQVRTDSLSSEEREKGLSKEHVRYLGRECTNGRILTVLLAYVETEKAWVILDGHHSRQAVLDGLAPLDNIRILVREYPDLAAAERAAYLVANKPQIGVLSETSKEKRKALDVYFTGSYRFGTSFRHPLTGDRCTADDLARYFGVARATIFNIVSRLETPSEDEQKKKKMKAKEAFLKKVKNPSFGSCLSKAAVKALLGNKQFIKYLEALGYSLTKEKASE
jgi:hypothetical protein